MCGEATRGYSSVLPALGIVGIVWKWGAGRFSGAICVCESVTCGIFVTLLRSSVNKAQAECLSIPLTRQGHGVWGEGSGLLHTPLLCVFIADTGAVDWWGCHSGFCTGWHVPKHLKHSSLIIGNSSTTRCCRQGSGIDHVHRHCANCPLQILTQTPNFPKCQIKYIFPRNFAAYAAQTPPPPPRHGV